MKQIYRFKNAPKPKQHWDKRQDHESGRIGDERFWRKIDRLKSPVPSDPTPNYMIQFHARERRGYPFVSYSMSASPADLAYVIAYWLLDASESMKFDPVEAATRILLGVKKSVELLKEDEQKQKENNNE